MKQIALALTILSLVFSQGAVAVQKMPKKETAECPQLTACKENWNKTKNLNDKEKYQACHTTACPQEKKKLEGCSKEDITAINAYNLHCRILGRQITNTGKQ